MEAYSTDLRERIVWECDLEIDTRGEIAERYGVSTSFIRKLLQRRSSGQSIAPKSHGGGRVFSISRHDLELVRELVVKKPDATLEELCQSLAHAGGSGVRSWTMCRALQRLELPRKKSPFMPASGIRRAFRSCVGSGWRR